MTNEELIKRYVYAVTEFLPKKNREEVSKELTANIDEMLEARCGDVLPTEQDVKVVLAELGNPDELAQKYDSDPVGHLIGGVYYTKYKMILKYVLIATVLGMSLASALGLIFENDGKSLAEGFGEWIGNIISTVYAAFTFVTVAFAILERKKVNVGSTSIDSLPAVPEKKEKIKVSDSIVNIVLTVFFTALVLWFGGAIMIGTVGSETDFRTIPLFNVDAVRAAWLPLVLCALSTVVRETVKIFAGRYDFRVMITTIITSVINIFCSAVFLFGSNVFNTDGLMELATSVPADAQQVLMPLFKNLGMVIFVICIVFGGVLDIVTSTVRALRNKAE